MQVLGITGNIAAGKTLIAALLAARGAHVVDADALVHELYQHGTPVFAAVAARFGDAVAGADAIDRAALAAIVFADRAAMRDLERIVHPAVGDAIRRRLDECPPGAPAVIEAIRLVEGASADLVDAVWIVTAPRDEHIARLGAQRGLGRADAEQRLDAQTPPEEKERTFNERRPGVPVSYIENSGSVEALRGEVERAWETFLSP
jgi:dephospho-CoA kinase